MPRLAQNLIDRLKTELPLEQLVAQAGVTLKRRGKDLVGRCPFHEDATASFIVTPAKNLFHCMGCGAAGSPIDWVMRSHNLSFRAAADHLVQQFFPLAAQTEQQPEPLRNKPLDLLAGDRQLIAQVTDHYHATAKAAPDWRAFLAKRGLAEESLIEHFQLGYADRSLISRLPGPDHKRGHAVREDLRRLGYLRESGHEHFHGCLTVPIFDEQGRVVEVYGRKIRDNQRKGSARHLYLPGPHRGIWNRAGLEHQTEVILCEALLDALTFWHHGFHNVTSSYGARGFTPEHMETFKDLKIKRVSIAYDRDTAGDEAAVALAKRLQAEGIAPYRVLFPKGMDANSFALKLQPAPKCLALVLAKAEWMGEGPEPICTQADPPASTDTPQAVRQPDSKPQPLVALAADSQAGQATVQPSQPEHSPNMPALPLADIEVVSQGEDLYASRGDRSYRVRGLEGNLSRNVLKVNLFAYRGEGFHADVLNLYSGYHRSGFAKQAARELGVEVPVIEKDLGRLLLRLEIIQDERIRGTLAAQPVYEMSSEEQAEAEAFLRDPQLLARLLDDFRDCGMIGEPTNKLAGYLVAISRKLDQPLGALIQSASASGKSTTMDAILAFVPEEDKVCFSAVTGQSLYYMGEDELKHKVIAIVEEEGAERASYPLNLLLSEGQLTIASTGKNDQTGHHTTRQYCVKGPVAVMLTTTAMDTDEEFQNRCLVLAVDESRDQTRAIHRLQRQRKTLEGLRTREQSKAIIRRHQNAQRLLRPLKVVNPFAESLTFLDTRTRLRRDNQKYLNLIDCIAFLHQYQREIKTVQLATERREFIEVTAEDVARANHLAAEVLGRTLDELSPQTRHLLILLHQMVSALEDRDAMAREDIRFTRRQIREHSGWSEFQVRTHMQKLLSMEYVLAHRGQRGQSFVYELLYDGKGRDGAPFLMGLIDAKTLTARQETGHVDKFEHGKGKNEPSTCAYRALSEQSTSDGHSSLNVSHDRDLGQLASLLTGISNQRG